MFSVLLCVASPNEPNYDVELGEASSSYRHHLICRQGRGFFLQLLRQEGAYHDPRRERNISRGVSA